MISIDDLERALEKALAKSDKADMELRRSGSPLDIELADFSRSAKALGEAAANHYGARGHTMASAIYFAASCIASMTDGVIDPGELSAVLQKISTAAVSKTLAGRPS